MVNFARCSGRIFVYVIYCSVSCACCEAYVLLGNLILFVYGINTSLPPAPSSIQLCIRFSCFLEDAIQMQVPGGVCVRYFFLASKLLLNLDVS